MLNKKVPSTILTDLESLFKVIMKSSTPIEKRLMIDIEATREAFERMEINNVGWIRSEYIVADGSIKISNCETLDKVWNMHL